MQDPPATSDPKPAPDTGMFGRRSDWKVARPRFRPLPNRLAYVGSLAIVVSVIVPYFAFTSESSNTALGLYFGAVSIILMAWSFVLSVRMQWIEPFFGGLDRAYQAHRWAGTFAVPAMFLHLQLGPEVDDGILGASQSTRDFAKSLAGYAEYFIYGLVAVSLLRLFPYRWWRLTHKLLGIPFAFASFHFYTIEKPYSNWSAWGWFFNIIMIAGLLGYLVRLIGRDVLFPGTAFRITEVVHHGATVELKVTPTGKPLPHAVGQFAALKVQLPGFREPHMFTIASCPDEPELRFFIRDLGDWTAKMQKADLIGAAVIIEGPYGEFAPLPDTPGTPTWWVAGGVGITPFLSAIGHLRSHPSDTRPHLVYAVHSIEEATALDEINDAAADGVIDFTLVESHAGERFTGDLLRELVGPAGLAGAHVAACGPSGLLSVATDSATALGVHVVERESFDIRSGIGPDPSRERSH